MQLLATVLLLLACVHACAAVTYFREQFEDGAAWKKRWTMGDAKEDFIIGKGSIFADDEAVSIRSYS